MFRRVLLAVVGLGLTAAPVCAETVELVTYYPAAATGDFHTQSLTVGNGYTNVTPNAGEAFIEGLLSVGSVNPVNIGGGWGAPQVTKLWLQDNTAGAFPALVIAGTPGAGGSGGGAVQFVDATTNAAVGDFGFSGVAAAASEVGIAARRNNAAISFYTTPAAVPLLRMVIQPSGSIGIGTPNPAGLLHLVGNNDATSNVLFMPGTDTAAAGTPDIRVGIGTTAPGGLFHVQGVNDATSNVLFTPGADTGAAGTPDIRVGIGPNFGAPFPGATLDVAGDIRISDSVVSASSRKLQFWNYNYANEMASIGLTGPPSYAMVFNTRTSNGALAERMRINGTSGILELPQSTAIGLGDAYMSSGIDGIGNHYGHFAFNAWYSGSGGAGGWQIPVPGMMSGLVELISDGKFWFFNRPAGGAPGWVGRFWVNADGSTGNNSDARSKTAVSPIPNALDRVAALRGVNFHWKEPSVEPRLRMGLMAQEVEKVFPELVDTDPKTGLKGMEYAQLTAALVEAVKELKTENELLRKEVEQLKKKVAE